MGEVGDLIGAQGAAAAGVVGPAEHPGLEEGAIDDQLPTAFEKVEQANLTLGSLELMLLHRRPRHAATLGGQRITGAGEGLLLHEELLQRSLPLLLGHDRGCLHRGMLFRVLLVSLFACCHFIFSFVTLLWGYRLCVAGFLLLLSSGFGTALFFLRDTLMASAASPPVETVPATTSPRVDAKQNGHMVHLSAGKALIAQP